jgi:hypothetical protein
MSLRQHKELGHRLDSQGPRFIGLLKEFASARGHCLPGGAQLSGCPSGFAVRILRWSLTPTTGLSEFSNNLLDGVRVSKTISEVKHHHGLAAIASVSLE